MNTKLAVLLFVASVIVVGISSSFLFKTATGYYANPWVEYGLFININSF